jgi:predicted ester cyclase
MDQPLNLFPRSFGLDRSTLVALLLVGSWLNVPSAQAQTAAPFPASLRSERVVRRFWDAFNRAAWAELDDLVTSDYAHHPPGKTLTLAQFKSGGSWVHQGLAKYALRIDALVATDTEVAIRWTARGIHAGSFFGESPTNREVTVQGMTFHAIREGRIAEDWEVIDFDGFKAQLRRP